MSTPGGNRTPDPRLRRPFDTFDGAGVFQAGAAESTRAPSLAVPQFTDVSQVQPAPEPPRLPIDWPAGIYPAAATDFRIGPDGRRRVLCWGKWRRLIETPKVCKVCASTFWAIEGDGDRTMCGTACRDADRDARNAQQVGADNPHWKGGVSTDTSRYVARRDPVAVRARYLLNLAVASGRIVPLPCGAIEDGKACGDPRVHGHHPDHSKPYDVDWLCQRHHSAVHGGRGVGAVPKREAPAVTEAA